MSDGEHRKLVVNDPENGVEGLLDFMAELKSQIPFIDAADDVSDLFDELLGEFPGDSEWGSGPRYKVEYLRSVMYSQAQHFDRFVFGVSTALGDLIQLQIKTGAIK